MPKKILTRHPLLAVLAASTVLGACKGNQDRYGTDTTASPGMVGTAATPVDTAAAAGRFDSAGNVVADSNNRNNNGWTDTQILAYAAEASRGEIAEAKIAEQKATNPAVKAFARQMVADHQKLLDQGQEFAKKNNLTPDSTSDMVRDLANDSRDEVQDLTQKAAGADWDEDYIEKQIDDHKAVLDKLQDAAKNANSSDLRAMLVKATGTIQTHLTKAEAIKANKLKA